MRDPRFGSRAGADPAPCADPTPGADSSPGADPAPSAGSWQQLEHPADLRLRLEGPSAAAIYAVAVRALSELLAGDAAPPPAPPAEEELHLDGFDGGDLLVCLCNEVIFRLESEGRLAVSFAPSLATPTVLEGTLALAPLPDPAACLGVKAATYGQLRWEVGRDGRVLAEITLDL